MTSKIDIVLDLLRSEPEDVALALLSASNYAEDQKESLQNQLRAVCGELFQRIEVLNGLRGEVAGREEEPPLSGLTELYTGDDKEGGDGVPVDAETLFGQIELQNQALLTKVKKSLNKLSWSLVEGGVVCLLDEGNVSDSEVSSDDSGNDDDSSVDDKEAREKESDGESEKEEEEEEEEDDGDDDEERRRIEARMQSAMEDMDEDDSDADADTPKPRENDEASEEKESLVDPAAEELNDGFFDINEMEKFADEEEEYLPDEAFGEEKPEVEDDQDKRSFHQKQRDGGLDDNEEESEDDGNELLFQKESAIRRKRYRDDDEIDALYQLYQGGVDENDDDEDSAMEATNMTAADLYGKPNKRYYENWNSKKSKKANKSDDDSWDEYDFEQERKKGDWNETAMESEREEERGSLDEGEDDQASDEDIANADEQVPMKSTKVERSREPTKRTDKLQKQTEQLEKEILAEKPWQMRGETTGTARPVDSLLDSTPEFEVATKQAPIITVEKTMDLEEVIKKRILNEDWDDVIPRELPDVAWNKKRGELPEVSQEKSKLGLGELYEREYKKKALGFDVDAAEKETEEEKAKNEIKSLFANLCSKLDALSNYHFAPRPIADEAEIRPLTKPAIAMEEVLPLHVSEARGVAPEEVYGAKRRRDAVIRGESELEQEDRKRMRSAKKAARRKARKEKLADEKLISKLQPGLGLNNPYEKRKMREELSVARAQGKITTGAADMNDYGKSTTFFKRMQQEAQQSIKGTSPDNIDFDEGGKRRSKSSAVKL